MKKRILAVDDSIVMREFFKEVLCDKYEVELAEDGAQAYEKALDKKNIYHLIITDLFMPRMDGLELIKKLRDLTHFRGVPILFISTEGAEIKKKRAREAGASGWIVKPADREQVLNAARKLIN